MRNGILRHPGEGRGPARDKTWIPAFAGMTLMVLSLCVPSVARADSTAYDRVMQSGTIRCGYGTSKPWIWQDLKTGKMTGLSVEIMDAIAEALNFKLDWPEETGWVDLPIALESGRVDVACSSLWVDPARGKHVAYTRPVFYTLIHAYARADDARFAGKNPNLNTPDVRIVVQEGDPSSFIADRYFPRASITALPQMAPWGDFYMNVATGKADIIFSNSVAVEDFNANNPTTPLKRVNLPAPVTAYATSFAVGIHETELKEMLDATILYLLDNGKIDEILKRFQKEYPDAIIPVARNWK